MADHAIVVLRSEIVDILALGSVTVVYLIDPKKKTGLPLVA
jgi:hypothetical protein